MPTDESLKTGLASANNCGIALSIKVDKKLFFLLLLCGCPSSALERYPDGRVAPQKGIQSHPESTHDQNLKEFGRAPV